MFILILFIIILSILLVFKKKETFYFNKANIRPINVFKLDWKPKYNNKKLSNYIDYKFFDKMVVRTLNDYKRTKIDNDTDKYVLSKFIEVNVISNLMNNYNNFQTPTTPTRHIISDNEIKSFILNDLDRLNKLLQIKNDELDNDSEIFIKYMIQQFIIQEDEYDEKDINIVLLPYLYNNRVIKISKSIYAIGLYSFDPTITKNIVSLPINKLSKYWYSEYYNKNENDIDNSLSQNIVSDERLNYNKYNKILKEINSQTKNEENKINKTNNELQKLYYEVSLLNIKDKCKDIIDKPECLNNIRCFYNKDNKKCESQNDNKITKIKLKINNLKENNTLNQQSILNKTNVILEKNNDKSIDNIETLKNEIKRLNIEIIKQNNEKKHELRDKRCNNDQLDTCNIESSNYFNKIQTIKYLYDAIQYNSSLIKYTKPCLESNNNICKKSLNYLDDGIGDIIYDSKLDDGEKINFDITHPIIKDGESLKRNPKINDYIYKFENKDNSDTLDPNYSYI